VFRGTLLHYYEKLFNAFSTEKALRAFLETHMEDRGLDAVRKGLARGNGVLLVTGHYGGIEFIPAYLSAKGYPVTIIVKFKSEHLRKISLEKAKRFGTEIIDPDQTDNMVRAIHEHLKQNRIVVTQCDEIEEWRPSKDKKISFLGKTINLDRAVNILLKRCGSSIVFGVMYRMADHRYQFVASSWEEMARRYDPEIYGSMGGVVLKYMEDHIYAHPEQWYQWKNYPEMTRTHSHETWRPVRTIGVLHPSPGIA
jgi:lauroyl/myristoyl acyltransferase